ncbi:MAG: class I SAM-dependent RNA methyltransferase [Rhodoferax sp.]
MESYDLFLPCAAGVEPYLAAEVQRITGLGPVHVRAQRAGVAVRAVWSDVLRLNLYSRMAQRVLIRLRVAPYRSEQDLYRTASQVPWEDWFTPRQRFKVELTAQHSPLTSLNFATLRIKDAVADRFRVKSAGVRPSVDTRTPDVRLFGHLTTDTLTLYIDTSGEPLFKRGWRVDKGEAPLKETLAAAMIAACGWFDGDADLLPLYDPCCGSGTIAIEAAQMACNIAAGSRRRFAFEHFAGFQAEAWNAIKTEAIAAELVRDKDQKPIIFGSDVAHRMVDFAQRNAERAGVADVIAFRGGDALQRLPPVDVAHTGGGVLLLNPPYGERIDAGGVARGSLRAGAPRDDHPGNAMAPSGGREQAQTEDGGDFFVQLASHWKKHYAGWTAWVLSPDPKLPGRMHLKAARRVPLFNGPIECRLMRFDLVAGRHAG